MYKIFNKLRFLKNYWFLVVFLFLYLTITYVLNRKDREYNEYRCETVKLELNGVINFKTGHGDYAQISLDNNPKGISFDIEKCISNNGFPENRAYQVGDSVIKKAGSKKVVIKNGKCIAVYILKCDD
jgi:hypothetical protein